MPLMRQGRTVDRAGKGARVGKQATGQTPTQTTCLRANPRPIGTLTTMPSAALKDIFSRLKVLFTAVLFKCNVALKYNVLPYECQLTGSAVTVTIYEKIVKCLQMKTL